MSALAPYAQSFLEELEKLSAKPVKETRKGWLAPKSRKGSVPMRVSTLLKKEKDGTLGGYKLASVLGAMGKLGESTPVVPFVASESPNSAPRLKKPGDVPSKDDTGGEHGKREDGRGNAATIEAPSTVLSDVVTQSSKDRTE